MVSTDLITGINLSQALAMRAVPTPEHVQLPSLEVANAALKRSLQPVVESTATTIVESSVVIAPPGAAQVTVTKASRNENTSSVSSGNPGSSRPPSVAFEASPIRAPKPLAGFVFGEQRLSLARARGKLQEVPRFLSRAANNRTATTLEELARAVFADADGQKAGNQPLRRRAAVLVRATNAEIRGTYLLVNNGNRRLNPSADLMVEITGFSGRLPGLGAIDPAVLFG